MKLYTIQLQSNEYIILYVRCLLEDMHQNTNGNYLWLVELWVIIFSFYFCNLKMLFNDL